MDNAMWKMVWQSLKKLNIKSPYDPAIPLQDTYPRKVEIDIQKCLHMNFSQKDCSQEPKGRNSQLVVYPYNEI